MRGSTEATAKSSSGGNEDGRLEFWGIYVRCLGEYDILDACCLPWLTVWQRRVVYRSARASDGS